MSIPDQLMENKELCTLEKRGNIYILTITGEGEHRLNPDFIDSILSALRRLKAEPTFPCSALITTAHGKFFCNGFDLAWVQSSVPSFKFLFSKLQSLVLEFLSLPMPTIAAITGHSLASGMALVLSHDYVLMRKDRGYLYFNEMDIRFVIPPWFINFIKCKITDAKVRQEAIMSAAKLTAEMAVARGIVHSAYDGAQKTVDAAIRLGEELVKRRWDGYVYANTRIEIFRDVMDKNLDDEGLEEDIKRFNTQSKM